MYLFCALEDDMAFRAGCKTRRKVHGHMGILLEGEGESFLEPPHALFSSWVGRKLRFPLLVSCSGARLGGMGNPCGSPNGRREGLPG